MPQFSPYRSRKGGETGNSLADGGGLGARGEAVRGTVVAEGKLPVLRLTGGFDSLKKADSGSGTAIKKG